RSRSDSSGSADEASGSLAALKRLQGGAALTSGAASAGLAAEWATTFGKEQQQQLTLGVPDRSGPEMKRPQTADATTLQPVRHGRTMSLSVASVNVAPSAAPAKPPTALPGLPEKRRIKDKICIYRPPLPASVEVLPVSVQSSVFEVRAASV